jgi:SAM-dependent methyltransferase
MSDRWHEFIRGGVERAGGPVPFALQQWEFLQPVVACVRRVTPAGGRILEVGCGSAILPSLLAHFGYAVTAIDNDERIVALGREMATFFRSPVKVEQGDAHNLGPYHGRFDVVYSLGVVEHFDPPVTQQLLQEQGRCGPTVVAVVPSRHTHYAAPVTDERLYSRNEFVRLVRGAGFDVTESFVYGSLPTWTARQLSRVAPKVILRPIQHLCTYGMGIGVVGRRVES